MIEFASNVPIAIQSGNIHGTLFICENATPTPGLEFFGCLVPVTFDPTNSATFDTATIDPNAITRTARVHIESALVAGSDPLHPVLTLSGTFTFVGGQTRGNGDIEGQVTLVLDAEGHIIALENANIALRGVWNGTAATAACPFTP